MRPLSGHTSGERCPTRANQLQIAGLNLAEIAHARGDDASAREHWAAGMQGYLQGMPDDSVAVIAAGLFGDASAASPTGS